ncbi:MAG: cytochrome c [Alphaproteobacteria bacterium]|nr:cytochrome c [Alphaproteobacteria bacterium]
MRRIILAFSMMLVAQGAQARSAHSQSIWNGAYTEDQAARGATSYQQNCARCHGAGLAGTFEIPPLMGRFVPYWSGSTLDVLVDYISRAMPLGRPGSLSPAVNADIVAFILKSNGFPAGSKELGTSADAQKAITFDATNKKRGKAH